MALIGMEGSSLHWIRWLRKYSPDMNWESLASELIKRYAGNDFRRLCSVRHTTSIHNYIDEFTEILTRLPGLTNDHYPGMAFNLGFGHVFVPSTLTVAVDMTRLLGSHPL